MPAPDALQQRKAKKALPPRSIDLTRFYHARTCIRMTKAEVERILLDPQRASDSDDEEDVEDWKVHIIVVVPDSGAGLAPSISQSKAHSNKIAHKGIDKLEVCCKAPCRFCLGSTYCPLYVQRNDLQPAYTLAYLAGSVQEKAGSQGRHHICRQGLHVQLELPPADQPHPRRLAGAPRSLWREQLHVEHF